MEIKRIETYSLFEFCQKIQEAIIEGWRFDFEGVENFPTAYGTMVTAGMLNVNDPLYNQQKEKEIIKEVIIYRYFRRNSRGIKRSSRAKRSC